MKAVNQFLIEPLNDALYDNKREFGDKTLIISSSIENHKTTNRQAIVKAVPINYDGPIKAGALIIVHHNVFRKYFDMKGKVQFSKNRLFENTYTIYEDVIYAYKNEGDASWMPLDEFCFVSPMDNDEEVKESSKKSLYGVMRFPNNELKLEGVKPNDVVGFTPESEYEFDIDGEVIYRVYSKDICLIQS